MSKSENVRRVPSLSDWFENVFGFRETVMGVEMGVVLEEGPEGAVIKTQRREISAGVFDVVDCSMFGGLTSRGSAELFIVDGQKCLESADFLALQGLPEFDGATFQVLSGFNCLPFVGPDQTAEMGITNYVYDESQGPSAAIACAGSLLYRNYFCANADGSRGQIGREIELLSGTPLRVEHGFVMITEQESQDLSALAFDWGNLAQYRVGVQRMCEVTTTRRHGRIVDMCQQRQRVHQVFTGTLRFGSLVVETSFTRRLAEHILSAGYRTCILAGWSNALAFPGHMGSNKLVLTTEGATASLVAAALCRSIDVIRECGLEIYFVHRGPACELVHALRHAFGDSCAISLL